MTDALTIVSLERNELITDAVRKSPAAAEANIQRFDSFRPATNGWLSVQPDIILVDLRLGETPRRVFDWIERYKLNHPRVAIFVCASDQVPELLLAAMRAGAQEYLPMPIVQDQLDEAISRILVVRRQHHDQPTSVGGKILSVYSGKGGLGVTTIAVNLGIAIARLADQPQALMGLNFQVEDVTSMLDLRPDYTVLDVLHGTDQIDREALQSCMTYHESGVYVLAEPSGHAETVVSPAQIRGILGGLTDTYPYSVLDLPHSLEPHCRAALEVSDMVLLVTAANINAIRAVRRSLAVLSHLGIGSHKARVILNRTSGRDEISAKDIEKTLDCEIFWSIPNDYPAVAEAINTGVPLVHGGRMSKVGKSVYQLAEQIVGPIEKD